MAEALLSGYQPQTIRVSGRRNLGYCLYGPGDGVPVVFFYGTPGTMFLAPDRLVPVDELGFRLLVADRPGYGASTRLPGRSIASVADDLAVLADHLGWGRFAVWGASGGGPHAWPAPRSGPGGSWPRSACRGLPPFGAEGLDWLAGITPPAQRSIAPRLSVHGHG